MRKEKGKKKKKTLKNYSIKSVLISVGKRHARALGLVKSLTGLAPFPSADRGGSSTPRCRDIHFSCSVSGMRLTVTK